MEQKTWRWRRKSSEKTIVVSEKLDLPLKGNEEEAEKAQDLERSLKSLNEKLTLALSESNAKDELLAKHVQVSEEAIAGWEKAEAEAASFKQELDDALQCKVAAEERMVNLDAALKECGQQLHAVREEQKQMVNDAAMKTLREKEKTQILEERLAELNKRLAKLGFDNNNLSKVLEVKRKLIDDLIELKSQAEANINAIMARLDSSEKDNTSLKYEVCMLEKELEIRNEEKDFNLKSIDAAHKQHLESVKKIAKLETECQRLRVMVRKRLPGPAALAKMKSEVEMLSKNSIEMKRKKSNSIDGSMTRGFMAENRYDSSSRRSSLVEKLSAMEEQNRILKETLTKKNSEIQSSWIMCARTASKLSQAETQLEGLSMGQAGFELARGSPVSYDMPLASISEDGGNEDNISCAESWASALISELEHFRNGKPMTPSSKSSEVTDLSLMNDFVEMERLAIVCVDKPFGNSHSLSGETNTSLALSETDSRPDLPEAMSKELIPLGSLSHFSNSNREIQSSSMSVEKSPSWLQDILRVILQKHHVTQISLDVILEEVRATLANMGHSVRGSPPDALHLSGNISQKPQYTSSGSFGETYGASMFLTGASNRHSRSNLDKSICKLIQLIEGIDERSLTDYGNQPTPSGNDENIVPHKRTSALNCYISRVFQWKSSELSAVLRHFIQICNDLLQHKADLKKFVGELTSTLEWIINHCFSLQDVSSMKDRVKKHFDWDELHSESELEVGLISPSREAEKLYALEEHKQAMGRPLPLSATANGLQIFSKREEIESKLKDENRRLKDEIMCVESRKNDLEERLESATTKNESLITQLQESEESISSLQVELARLKETKGLIEDQIENQKLLNEELDTKLSVAKVELNEARQKLSSLEVALEDKINCCEELEATCLELQLQLESVATKETPTYDVDEDQKQLRTNWEISAASEKLAECQETILNLGKQLKALASPRDAALFDKVIYTPDTGKINRHPELLDQMLAEDDQKFEELKSPKTKEMICPDAQKQPVLPSDNPNAGLLYDRKAPHSHGTDNPTTSSSIRALPIKSPGRFYGLDESNKHKAETDDAGVLAVVPNRHKSSASLLRKLLSRRKKESSKKLTLHSAS